VAKLLQGRFTELVGCSSVL